MTYTTNKRGNPEIKMNCFIDTVLHNRICWLSFLTLVLFLTGFVGAAEASVFDNTVRWPTDSDGITRIPVCIVAGSSATQYHSADLLNEVPGPGLAAVINQIRYALATSWEEYSSVRFVSWQDCDDLSSFDQNDYVHLYIHPDRGNNAILGKNAKGKTANSDGALGGIGFKPWGNGGQCIDYTFPASFTHRYDCVEQYAIHEFGHVLGFKHEWTHPLRPSGCTNRPSTETIITSNHEKWFSHSKGYTIIHPDDYDLDSIMTYDSGCADVTGERFGSTNLSIYDMQGVRDAYPLCTTTGNVLTAVPQAVPTIYDNAGLRPIWESTIAPIAVDAPFDDAIRCFNTQTSGSYTMYGDVWKTDTSPHHIDNENTAASLTIDLENNTFDAVGGFIVEDDTTVTFSNIIIQPTGTNYGSAIWAKPGSKVTINAAAIINEVQQSGGAIYADDNATVTMNGGVLEGKAVQNGGALEVDPGATVTLNDVEVKDSTAGFDGGAAYVNAGGELIINGGSFTNNSASYGGAIYVATGGETIIDDATFSENTATASGGAIRGLGGTIKVTASTFNNNNAADGGAFHVRDNSILNITNSTLSGNSASDNGGGIRATNGSNTTLNHVTIAKSIGSSGSLSGDAPFTVRNSLLIGLSVNCTATAITLEGSNFSTDSSCTGMTTISNDELNAFPLTNNGGDTETIAVGQGSLVIDAADCANSPSTDQRGEPRNDGQCDAGAFEAGAFADQYEPDNGWPDYTDIASGDTQTHSIFPIGDKDVLQFYVEVTSTLVIETSGIAGGDTVIKVTNENGTEDIDEDDDDGIDTYSRIEMDETNPIGPGYYYLYINEYTNDEAIKTYQVAMTLTAITPDVPLAVTVSGGQAQTVTWLPVVGVMTAALLATMAVIRPQQSKLD